MKNSMMRWRRFREEVENNYLSTEVLKMAGVRGAQCRSAGAINHRGAAASECRGVSALRRPGAFN